MVLNLYTLNSELFWPILFWVYKTDPRSKDLISNATSNKSGEITIRPTNESVKSRTLFVTLDAPLNVGCSR